VLAGNVDQTRDYSASGSDRPACDPNAKAVLGSTEDSGRLGLASRSEDRYYSRGIGIECDELGSALNGGVCVCRHDSQTIPCNLRRCARRCGARVSASRRWTPAPPAAPTTC